jgi:hypothetical protein
MVYVICELLINFEQIPQSTQREKSCMTLKKGIKRNEEIVLDDQGLSL